MNLQQLIYLVLLTSLFTTTILYGRLRYQLQSLEDLIASSPAVCYSCRQYGDGIELVPLGTKAQAISVGHIDGLKDHEYIDARLVYIPDKLLR